jgi:outer membrane protein
MNMKMWKRIAMGVTAAFILGIGAISATQSTSYAAPSNAGASIGFVDMQQVVINVQDYKDAQTTLATEFENLKKEFETKSSSLNEGEKKQLLDQYQQRFNLRKQEVIGKVNEKVNAAVKDVATAQGISIVLDKESVLYGGKDLTQDVINKLK